MFDAMAIHYSNFGNFDDDWDDEPAPAPRPVKPAEVEPPTRIGVGLPAVVVVPVHPRLDDGGISIELSAEVSGDPVAIIFSTVERLIERLGRHQPWVMIPAVALPELLGTPAISIVLDPLPKTCRIWWTSDRLKQLDFHQDEIEEPELRGDIRA
ncbi:SAV_915 family protein [Nocardia sp. NPDC051981]|uniref:SAV_915 family protein n=1 Tax=Nocardia sp. NPDC051981 TaxID=3155417 RepID=UPI003440E122